MQSLLKKNKYLYIRSLRHYLLNKQNNISKVIYKNRKNNFKIFLQFFKTLVYQTTFFNHLYKVKILDNFSRVGISSTKNQTRAIMHNCDVIILLDKRAKINNYKIKYIYILPNFFYFIYKYFYFLFLLRKTNYFLFADIITQMNSREKSKLLTTINNINKSVIVANLNSPLIIFYCTFLRDKVKFLHLPHSRIGKTIVPNASLVKIYFAKGKKEYFLLKQKFPKTKIKLIKFKVLNNFIPSNKKEITLVLPKNWKDVDCDSINSKTYKNVLVKPHPAAIKLERIFIYLFFKFKLKNTNIKFIDFYYLESKIYSSSSNAIFELIELGKCIYVLPMKKKFKDHYFDSNFPKPSEDELLSWKKQVNFVNNY